MKSDRIIPDKNTIRFLTVPEAAQRMTVGEDIINRCLDVDLIGYIYIKRRRVIPNFEFNRFANSLIGKDLYRVLEEAEAHAMEF